MDGYTAHPDEIGDAARGVDALTSRVHEIHRTNDDVTHSLTDAQWGLLHPVRNEFLSLAAEFEQHLGHMSGAMDGASERLHRTGAGYSAAETMIFKTLALTGKDHGAAQEIRQLNWVSRFYQEHHTAYGLLTAEPHGQLGLAGLDLVRLVSDSLSDDKFNISTDIANLASDASYGVLGAYANYKHLLADPLGFLVRHGIGFLLSAFYWTKSIVDRLTGDPIAIGQAAYNFDSIAESCRRLAEDLGDSLSRTLSGQHGTAADTARERLTGLRDGIAQTGHSADRIAALLQIISALIADVEGILRGMISNVIVWAVYCWLSAGLLAAGTAGLSEVAATREILRASSETAGEAASVLAKLTSFIRRIGGLMARLRVELRYIKEKFFAKLSNSSVGPRFWDSAYGGAAQQVNRISRDVGRGKDDPLTRITPSHIFVSTSKQVPRAVENGALNKFGWHRYNTDEKGEDYPDGKRHLRPHSYQLPDGEGGMRSPKNRIGMISAPVATMLPFVRGYQYWSRSGHVPSDQVIDRNLDLWGTRANTEPAESAEPAPSPGPPPILQ